MRIFCEKEPHKNNKTAAGPIRRGHCDGCEKISSKDCGDVWFEHTSSGAGRYVKSPDKRRMGARK